MSMGPGYGLAASGQGGMRASDADRERAAEVLRTGFAEGRLDKDEYDVLLGQVYTAKTHADLATLTSQLPGGGSMLFTAAAPVPGRSGSVRGSCPSCRFRSSARTASAIAG